MTDLDLAAVSLVDNQIIEASAGTGKTYTITNLYLRLILGRGRPALAINEILILTFTIAATDELKARVAERIRQARHAFRTGEGDDFLVDLVSGSEDRDRETKLLAAADQLMDEASIFTIHGFCARVLAEQAFESGVLFEQDMSAERDQILLQAAEDYFRTEILTLPAGLRGAALSIWSTPAVLARKIRPYLFRDQLTLYPEDISQFDGFKLEETALSAMRLWVSEKVAAAITDRLPGNRTPAKRLNVMNAFCRAGVPDLKTDLWQVYGQENLEKSLGNDIPEFEALALIEDVHSQMSLLTGWLWYEAIQEVKRLLVQSKDRWNQFTIDDLLTQTAGAVTREGSNLPATLAERWPVAMIDEFQDTDSVQYDIFRSIYQTPGQSGQQTLLMIGDPKQAIYQFRGADVFTYINARRQTGLIQSLSTNWRSRPALVEATNQLFGKPGIFGNDKDMPFKEVGAAAPNAKKRITIDGATATPYQFFCAGDGDQVLNINPALDYSMAFAAEEIIRLLASAQIDDKPVNAGQMAILVRSRRDAIAAEAALHKRGIKSVYLTLESVFLQDTAYDLKLLLDAIAEPTSDRAIRAALATRLMQSSAAEIDALNYDVTMQQAVLSEFREYHALWLEKNIAPMLNSLIVRRELAEKWLVQPEGERQITNLRHLTELLQQRAMATPGMFQLIKWFEREQREAETVDSEERQLRLESDDNLVKIVTMHAAKGLEYDIVMVPMSVFGARNNKSEPALFHEVTTEKYHAALELGSDRINRNTSTQEAQDEDMRLLYVALTRARYRCYLGLSRTSDFARSAIARLLGLDKLEKDDSLIAQLQQQQPSILPVDLFEIVKTGNDIARSQLPGTSNIASLSAPPARPYVNDQWRVHSYTGVTARLVENHQPAVVTGFADDEQTTIDADNRAASRFSMTRGPRAGVTLHSMMEDIDFQDTSTHEPVCQRTLKRLGLEQDWQPVLTDWLSDILTTPLGDHALADISNSDRLDEMEFHFPLDSAPALLKVLGTAGYVESAETEVKLEGVMTGLIDLLYRHESRYYIVDYKSNFLGYSFEHYSAENLEAAMREHNYFLQMVIYTVAINRMLKTRIADYDYEKHFGGVRYLFLRGMDGSTTSGVFSHRPDANTIANIDGLLAGAP